MLSCAPLPVPYVVYNFKAAVNTAAAPVCMLQCSTTQLVLLQPAKDNPMQALELGTNSSKMVC